MTGSGLVARVRVPCIQWQLVRIVEDEAVELWIAPSHENEAHIQQLCTIEAPGVSLKDSNRKGIVIQQNNSKHAICSSQDGWRNTPR